MLRFTRKPDSVFLAILHGALELRRDDVRRLRGKGEVAWYLFQPELAPYFTPDVLLEVIDNLIAASKAAHLYDLTDYHWLVIYDALEVFCDLHNEEVRQSTDRRSAVGPYQIGHIDFIHMVNVFFHDTDFLCGDELVEAGADFREQGGFSSEAFSIAAGLAPHPTELELRPCVVDVEWNTSDDFLASGEVPLYPAELEEDDD
jgi:hypothetical protein